MSDDLGRAPSVAGSRPADQAPTGLDRPGFDPSRTAAPFSREEIKTLYDECRGWHDCLDYGRIGDGAFTIRCENGESEQTRLNLRATLREVATVLAGILSADASGIAARSDTTQGGVAVRQEPDPKGTPNTPP